MMRRSTILGCFAALLVSQSALAVSYPLPPEGSRLVGSPRMITVPADNRLPLEAFAAQYGQGLSNMLEANPGADPFLPKSGSQLVVPQQIILANGAGGDCGERGGNAPVLLSQRRKYR